MEKTGETVTETVKGSVPAGLGTSENGEGEGRGAGPFPGGKASYNEAVETLASGLYRIIDKGGFTQESLEQIAKHRHQGTSWEELPARLKLCFVRLSVAMIPKPEAGSMEAKENGKGANDNGG